MAISVALVRLFMVVAACTVFACTTAHCGDSAGKHYLFTYFVGNGEDGLHLLYSDDGLEWRSIAGGRSLLPPEDGQDKLMRDPAVVQAPDGTFHLVWTVSWGERGIGYSSSRDLINWSPQRYLPLMEHEPAARNCWAPEAFYDPATQRFIVYWATTIPGKFPETDGHSRRGENDPGYNHRMYYVTTSNFQTFSTPAVLYDHGFNVIDATLVQDGKRYAMILKDETDRPYKPEKNLRVAFADSATGPYGAPSAPITGNYWAEGPTAIKIGKQWHVYFDKYTERKYGVITSPDLRHWTDESDKLNIPPGVRHGTVFEVPAEVAERLLELE